MNPVYLRLLEIAEELGQTPPVPNTYFERLLSVSSGRISQIADPLSIAKVGAKGLSNLAEKGFNPKWVNEGRPHAKYLSSSSDGRPAVEPPSKFPPRSQRDIYIAEINDLLENMNDFGVGAVLSAARAAAKDFARSKQTGS